MGEGLLERAEAAPLCFAFWPVQRAVVEDNIRRFARQTGEAVDAMVVDGSYHEAIEAAFAAGRGPDVLYAQRAEAAAWDAAGLIADLDEADPTIAGSIYRMDRRYVDNARAADGRLLGLTYYNAGPFQILLNTELVDPGMTWTRWDALLDHCRQLKERGVAAHPFVPRWHATHTGLVWSLLCHIATEGVLDLAAAEAEPAIAGCIAFWRRLVDDDLVPQASLADRGDAPALERWASGRHAVTFTMDYLIADAAECGARLPPFSVPAERLPGRTGDYLVPGHALLCVRHGLSPARRARAMRLLAFLGGEDLEGRLYVHGRWLGERLFPVPYPELDRDVGIGAAMVRHFPASRAADGLRRLRAGRAAARCSPPTRDQRMLAWSTAADAAVRRHLTVAGETADGVAARLVDLWQSPAP
jgi:multiple sugar transport system substrate-binding protein